MKDEIEYLKRMMDRCKGDDLERTKAEFEGQDLSVLHGQSGLTRRAILRGYQNERDLWTAARRFLENLSK